jgi:predicted transcriptional regulator
MTDYSISKSPTKAIKLKVLVRAYELLNSTDLTSGEIARALNVPNTTLRRATERAESYGLKKTGAIEQDLFNLLRSNSNKEFSLSDIAIGLNITKNSAKLATERLTRKKLICIKTASRNKTYSSV